MDRLRCKLFALAVFCASPCLGGPQGGAVVDGTALITQSGKTTAIRQTTDRAIINWQRFESTPTETIRFDQPGTTSVTLNRVIGVDPSLIQGALQANGQLFLINPSGIVFGPTARVNVGSLVASTLKITDDDFKAGRYILIQDPGLELSSVINRGSITAAPGGLVALIAPIVDNEGTIVATAGRVVLAAQRHARLDDFDEETGTAGGFAVRMPTVGLTPLLEEVVNTSSIAPANRVQRLSDGTVFLRGAGGIAVNGGAISVNGTADLDAGTAEVSGDAVAALAPGSRISALAPGARSGSGTATVRGQDVIVTAGGSSSRRAVVEAGSAQANAFDSIHSDAAGSLEFRGPVVNLFAGANIGQAGKPVRTNATATFASCEQDVAMLADGDLTVGFIEGSLGTVTLRATGSILAGDGAVIQLLGGGIGTMHLYGGNFDLEAGGVVGGATPLGVFGAVSRVVAPGGQNLLAVSPAFVQLPATSSTISLQESDPVPRSTYVPPADPVDAPADASVGAIGGRDNVLVPTLRSNLVKGEGSSAPDAGDAGLIVVERGTRGADQADPSEPASDRDGRLARAGKRRR